MDESERKQAVSRGYGKVKKVVHTATLLHNGWEMDNQGWIVEFEDGQRAALTTSHGGVYPWTKQEAEEKLAETEASAASIRKALEFWPADYAASDTLDLPSLSKSATTLHEAKQLPE